jgi:hypothetical protein
VVRIDCAWLRSRFALGNAELPQQPQIAIRSRASSWATIMLGSSLLASRLAR